MDVDVIKAEVKQKNYKIQKIFNNEKELDELFKGLTIADCMKTEISSSNYNEDLTVDIAAGAIDLKISDTLTCSYCKTKFIDKNEQRLHYKLDWHRHNLKLSLKGMKHLNEEEFLKLADDVSSISGSESNSSDDEDDEIKTELLGVELSVEKHQFIRHSKTFFTNEDNKILSIYKCVLHGKDDTPKTAEDLCKLFKTCNTRNKWTIIMIGGGHFAAAVFNGNDPYLHKTFHSYTVRARQGGSQSSKDSKSGTSHPKSAGASLRRYNEASFQQHIHDVLETWNKDIESCDLIYLRAVGHNRSLIFGKQSSSSVIKKNDSRIRNIPFPTRRATFKEVKRVHDLLSSIEVYGTTDEFLNTEFPLSPNKNKKVEPIKEILSEPQKADKKKKIDRGKPRLSPCRPLPEEIEKLAALSSTDDDVEFEFETNVCDFVESLKEYDDDVPYEQKQKYNKKHQKKKSNKNKIEQEKQETIITPEMEWSNEIVSARNNTELFKSLLSERINRNISDEDAIEILNKSIDSKGNTLLHHASSHGLIDRIRLLLEFGVNPAIRNKDKNTPFKVAKDWDSKKVFRRFQADFPDKFNYELAEIPGPLTKEMELAEEAEYNDKKKSQKKAKKDRLIEKKKIELEKRKLEEDKKREQEEKERYLQLSDREKRALAAERRLLASGNSNVFVRCFLCASDMTGKTPFSYQEYNFCSMACLKAHRLGTTKKL